MTSHKYLGTKAFVTQIKLLSVHTAARVLRSEKALQLTYTVFYSYAKREQDKPLLEKVKASKEQPLLQGATSPTLPAVAIRGKQRIKVHGMAGVFSVPEGERLHPEDVRPAPSVLLSPDWQWPYGADLFGNVNSAAALQTCVGS